MSRDGTIYKIKKANVNEKAIIDSRDLDYGEYLFENAENAPDYLKSIGTAVIIRYHLTDTQKACQDLFHSPWDSMLWSEKGYTCFYGKKELGFLPNEVLRKYDYDEDRESYIAKIDRICSIDNCYHLSFGSGVYTFEEIANECIRIVEDDEFEMEQELVCALVKALKYSKDGEKIYFFVD